MTTGDLEQRDRCVSHRPVDPVLDGPTLDGPTLDGPTLDGPGSAP